LQGNLNLVNTSFPVLMFEPRSYLQVRPDMQRRLQLASTAVSQAHSACLCMFEPRSYLQVRPQMQRSLQLASTAVSQAHSACLCSAHV
jgi:hypothetical protein